MKRISFTLSAFLFLGVFAISQDLTTLKVFISVDMEGIAGVINRADDVSKSGNDYGYFRRIMTLETNAAVEGALEAGASEIIVRDSHGNARNIIPDMLHKEAKLLRDWSGSHLIMMEG